MYSVRRMVIATLACASIVAALVVPAAEPALAAPNRVTAPVMDGLQTANEAVSPEAPARESPVEATPDQEPETGSDSQPSLDEEPSLNEATATEATPEPAPQARVAADDAAALAETAPLAFGEGCSYAGADSGGEYAQTLCWLDLDGLTTQYQFVRQEGLGTGSGRYVQLTFQSVQGAAYGSVTVRGAASNTESTRVNNAWAALNAKLFRASGPSTGANVNGAYYGPLTGWPVTVELVGGYTLTAKIDVSAPDAQAALAVTSAAFPTWGSIGSVTGAFLGRNNFYTGVTGTPAIYQNVVDAGSTTTTATLRDVTLSRGGANVTGYAIVVADAESTDQNESITWTTSGGSGFTWLPNDPRAFTAATTNAARKTAAVGNACGTTDANQWPGLNPTNRNSVTCSGATTAINTKSGTAMLQVSPTSAQGSLSVSQSMKGAGRQGVAFGVLTASASANVVVTDRVVDPSGNTTDAAFTVNLSRPGSSTPANTGSANKNASTHRLAMPVDFAGTQLEFSSSAAGGFTTAYTAEWVCTKTGDLTWGPSATPPAANNAWFKLLPGQLIDCTVTYRPPYVTLAKTVDQSDTRATNVAADWNLTMAGSGAFAPATSQVMVTGDKPGVRVPVIPNSTNTADVYALAEQLTAAEAWQYGYDWTALECRTAAGAALPTDKLRVTQTAGQITDAALKVARGDDIVCNYTNTANEPRVITHKQAFGADGAEFAFAGAVNAGNVVRYKLTFDNSVGTAAMALDSVDYLGDVLDDADFTADSVRISDGTEVGYPEGSMSNSGLTVNEELLDGTPRLSITGQLQRGKVRTVWFEVVTLANDDGAEARKAGVSRGPSSSVPNEVGYAMNNYLVERGAPVPAVCGEPAVGEYAQCTHQLIPAWSMNKDSRPGTGSSLHKGGNAHYELSATKMNEATTIENLVFTDDLTHVFKTAGWAPDAAVPGGALSRGIYFFDAQNNSLDSTGAMNGTAATPVAAYGTEAVPEPSYDEQTGRWRLTSQPVTLPVNAMRAELWFAVEAGQSPKGIPAEWTGQSTPAMGWQFVNYATGSATLAPSQCFTDTTEAPNTALSPTAGQPADTSFPAACRVTHKLSDNYFTIRKDAAGVGEDLERNDLWGIDNTGLWNMVGHEFEIRDDVNGEPSAEPSKMLCRTEYNPANNWDGEFSYGGTADWGQGSATLDAIIAYNNTVPETQQLPLCALLFAQGSIGNPENENAGAQEGRWRSEYLSEGTYWLVETRAPDRQISQNGTESRHVEGVQLLSEAIEFTVWPDAEAEYFDGTQSMHGRGQLDVAGEEARCMPNSSVAARPVACVNPTGYLMLVKDTIPLALPFTGGLGLGLLLGGGVTVLLAAVGGALWWRRRPHDHKL